MKKVRKRKFLMIGVLVVLCTFLLSGCSAKKNADNETQNNQIAMEQQEIKEKLDDALKNADDHLQHMQSQISNASDSVKDKLEQTRERIQTERQRVVDKMEEVKNASETNWDEVKSETNRLVEDNKTRIDSLINSVSDQFQ